MDTKSFYGKLRLRFLATARDLIEENAGNDNDEEGDDNILDNNYMHDEIAGEVEIHGEDSEEENNAEHGHDDVTNTISKRWRKNEKTFFGELDPILKSDVVGEHAEESMHDIFSLFFTDDIISQIVEQTNLFAQRDKNALTFSVDAREMRKFLGLLIMSGYHCLPSEKDYWRTADDMEAPIFSKVMSRDRFRIIKKYLHISDNENLAHSKVAKNFPLFDMLRNNCQQFGVFHEQLSIDESMAPYRGLHSAKQFIKSKPVWFGYKLWMLCSSDGFP
ncbi:piggyBac transposable element-derived protein 3-like [Lepeophtheirus salmonis]|uniref:piggyBac transposable element-derived protein 3-like n=1 Tax=Lepeophtheirus salmonis TaxID=72036 RepID=UPI003AF39AF2